MVLAATLLNTQYYKVWVKWSNPGKEYRPPQHVGVVAIEKGGFELSSSKAANLLFLFTHS